MSSAIREPATTFRYCSRERRRHGPTRRPHLRSFKFNYKDVARGNQLEQKILLEPGDTIVVP